MVAIVNNHQFTSLNPQGNVTPPTKEFEGVQQHPSAFGLSHKKPTEKDSLQVSSEARFVAAVTEFEKTVQNLRHDATATVRVGDGAVVSASAGDEVQASSLTVKVTNLASAQKLESGSFADANADLGGGTLTLSSVSGSFKITVTGGLKHTAEQINAAKDNFGVTASLETDADGARLILRANRSGESGAFTVVAQAENMSGNVQGLALLNFSGGGDGGGLRQVAAARNAQYEIDGRSYTSEDNVVSSSGITIELKGRGATRLDVSQGEGRSLEELGGKVKLALGSLLDNLGDAGKNGDKLKDLIHQLRGRLKLEGDDMSGLLEAGILKKQGKGFGLDVDMLQQAVAPVLHSSAKATHDNAGENGNNLQKMLADNLSRMAERGPKVKDHHDNGKRHNDNGLEQRSDAASSTGEARAKQYAEVQASAGAGPSRGKFDF